MIRYLAVSFSACFPLPWLREIFVWPPVRTHYCLLPVWMLGEVKNKHCHISSLKKKEKVTHHWLSPTLTSSIQLQYWVPSCCGSEMSSNIRNYCYFVSVLHWWNWAMLGRTTYLWIGRKTVLSEILTFFVCVVMPTVNSTFFTYGDLIAHSHVAFSCGVWRLVNKELSDRKMCSSLWGQWVLWRHCGSIQCPGRVH